MTKFLILILLVGFCEIDSIAQDNTIRKDTMFSKDSLFLSTGYLENNSYIGFWSYLRKDSLEFFEYIYYGENNLLIKKKNIENNIETTQMFILNSSDSTWVPHGLFSVYTSNTLSSVYNYNHGELSGLCLDFYSNGNIKKKSLYENNVLEGEYFEYNSKGGLKIEGAYTKGSKTDEWIVYYDNGKIKEKGKYIVIEATIENIFKYNVTSYGGDYFSIKDGDWFYFDDERGNIPNDR